MPVITTYSCPACRKTIDLGWNSSIRDHCPHCGVFLKGLRTSNQAEMTKYLLFFLFMSCAIFTPGFPIGLIALVFAGVMIVKMVKGGSRKAPSTVPRPSPPVEPVMAKGYAVRSCPRCGGAIAKQDRFCAKCGAAVPGR